MDMVPVPPGTIALRDDRVNRRWSVELQGFEIGRYPVTHAQYAEVLERTGLADESLQSPIVNVSWLDAVQFCNALSTVSGFQARYQIDAAGCTAAFIEGSDGYRLPTEAEWEYACRAGTNTSRYGALDDIAWYRGNSSGSTHPVGLKEPNAWGIHDMLGNVWEWCQDQYDPEVYGLYRVFRGGGWSDEERSCMAMNRRRSHPTFAIDDLGFRVVRSLRAPG
jgi:formylglycine-generating enzyme required for sulfatase activity